MERFEIFRRLLESERNAKALNESALRQREALPSTLEAAIAEMRTQKFAEADAQIAQIEERAIKRADADIAAQDLRLQASLARMQTAFDAHRSELLDRIFNIVINSDTAV